MEAKCHLSLSAKAAEGIPHPDHSLVLCGAQKTVFATVNRYGVTCPECLKAMEDQDNALDS